MNLSFFVVISSSFCLAKIQRLKLARFCIWLSMMKNLLFARCSKFVMMTHFGTSLHPKEILLLCCLFIVWKTITAAGQASYFRSFSEWDLFVESFSLQLYQSENCISHNLMLSLNFSENLQGVFFAGKYLAFSGWYVLLFPNSTSL